MTQGSSGDAQLRQAAFDQVMGRAVVQGGILESDDLTAGVSI